jgi:transcriptional regulator with XRE-family HTH domain
MLMEIVMRFPEWLKQSGMTQEAFAAKVGVTQGRISQIIQGKPPSWKLAAKIKEATGGEVSADDFLALEAAE